MDKAEFEKYVKQMHAGQTRWNGKPYFEEHCLKVAEHAMKLYKEIEEERPRPYADEPDDIWCVALGHDLLEDTRATIDEITRIVGNKIAVDICYLTKFEGNTYSSYIHRIIESENFIVLLVKLADLECNMEDLKKGSMRDKYELCHTLIERKLWKEIHKSETKTCKHTDRDKIESNLKIIDNKEGKCIEMYWSKDETLTGIHIPGCGGDECVFVNEQGKIKGILFGK